MHNELKNYVNRFSASPFVQSQSLSVILTQIRPMAVLLKRKKQVYFKNHLSVTKKYLPNTSYLPTYWVNSNKFFNCSELNALLNKITLSIITLELKALFKTLTKF